MRTSAKEHDRIYARLLTHSHHRINMSRSWRIATTENRWPFTSSYVFYTKLERSQCIWKKNVMRSKCLDVLTCCLYYHWFPLQNMSLTLHMCVRYAMYSSALVPFVTVSVHARLGMNDGRMIISNWWEILLQKLWHTISARVRLHSIFLIFASFLFSVSLLICRCRMALRIHKTFKSKHLKKHQSSFT